MTRFVSHSLAALAALFITVLSMQQVVAVPPSAPAPAATQLA